MIIVALDDEKKNEIQNILQREEKSIQKVEQQPPKDDQSSELIREIHKEAIVQAVKSDDKFKDKFVQQAEKSIDNELESLNQENVKRRQKTTYDANAEACKNYGIDNDVPLWEIRFMKIGSGFWFIIYWVFASLTIAPVNIFFKGIKSFIKTGWLVLIFALIAYLLIVVGLPLLIAFLNGGFEIGN